MLYFLETTGAEGDPLSSLIGTGAMLLLMIGLFYFMLIRPENKRKKETENMRSSTKVGDKITTIGGIVGTIVHIKDDKLIVETGADQVRIELMKWSISSNETAAERAAEEAKKERETKAKAKAVRNLDKEKK